MKKEVIIKAPFETSKRFTKPIAYIAEKKYKNLFHKARLTEHTK